MEEIPWNYHTTMPHCSKLYKNNFLIKLVKNFELWPWKPCNFTSVTTVLPADDLADYPWKSITIKEYLVVS